MNNKAESRSVPLQLGAIVTFDTNSCKNNTVEAGEVEQSIDLLWSIPKDYDANNKALLLRYGKVTEETLINSTRYDLDNEGKYIEIGCSTHLDLQPVTQIRDGATGCADSRCNASFSKNNVFLDTCEWEKFTELESHVMYQFVYHSSEIQRVLKKFSKEELSIRNMCKNDDITDDVTISYNWEYSEDLSSPMGLMIAAAVRTWSKQYLIFKEEEWIQFHEQQENINKYYQTFDTMRKPRQIGSKTLTFEMIEEKNILKIEDMSGNEVYLGWESVSEVWSLESVLRYRLSYSPGSNFKHFYEDVIRAVAEMAGDVKINIYNIINRLSEKSDDMWMLYAQEHWTKSYDLKSAVERLYEDLGALEFDADREAIYGVERYYTVQHCEELRDKYKIGRKVCRTFLQGKTCSQSLVKISEIGLRHFLDTINNYIKNCSDSSSSSSDEEIFKAVEQNGKDSKTTEEE
ncbi:hypothetical protein FQA39_LY08795 [Lamprigera yunnana]|nr:hypothetical protein FQA39_LY08795 [Lamprigera yunnana]